jgi:hypothetical protein
MDLKEKKNQEDREDHILRSLIIFNTEYYYGLNLGGAS